MSWIVFAAAVLLALLIYALFVAYADGRGPEGWGR